MAIEKYAVEQPTNRNDLFDVNHVYVHNGGLTLIVLKTFFKQNILIRIRNVGEKYHLNKYAPYGFAQTHVRAVIFIRVRILTMARQRLFFEAYAAPRPKLAGGCGQKAHEEIKGITNKNIFTAPLHNNYINASVFE